MDTVEIRGGGWVYVLTNAAMPGLVKIGMTERDDIGIRLSELNSTGVPGSFELAHCHRTDNPRKLEQSLHRHFGDSRYNPKKEFFTLSVDEVRDGIDFLTSAPIPWRRLAQMAEADVRWAFEQELAKCRALVQAAETERKQLEVRVLNAELRADTHLRQIELMKIDLVNQATLIKARKWEYRRGAIVLVVIALLSVGLAIIAVSPNDRASNRKIAADQPPSVWTTPEGNLAYRGQDGKVHVLP